MNMCLHQPKEHGYSLDINARHHPVWKVQNEGEFTKHKLLILLFIHCVCLVITLVTII